MATNPLLALSKLGQSVWLDNIERGMLQSGELARMIRDDGLKGITSNPTIFQKAITGSQIYSDAIDSLRDNGASDLRRATSSSRVACITSMSSGSGLRIDFASASLPRSATSRRRISFSISFRS